MTQLRPYQEHAVNSIFHYFSEHDGNPIVAMPTGTGKSHVIAAFLQRALHWFPTTRVLKLTHVKELIEQNRDKLKAHWPQAPVSIYSAGLGEKNLNGRIVFAGIASIARVDPKKIGHVDFIVIDECHLVSHRQETMYRRLFDSLRAINPKLKIVGLTATPYRLGHGMLTDGGGVFTDVCYDITTLDGFNRLLIDGYLAPVVPKRTRNEIDLTEVRTRNGEFVPGDLQRAADRRELTEAACVELVNEGRDRHHWLVFCSGIEHAEHVAAELRRHGIRTACVHSKMPDNERDRAIEDFRAGRVRAITNNGILTTGFDYPEIDMIGVLRATKSTGLWVQLLGRGTRPCEGKDNCLVLDFGGNTERLGPINDPVIPARRGQGNGARGAPVKECPECHIYSPIQVMECPHCGYEFPRQTHFTATAATRSLLAEEPQVATFHVDQVTLHRHKKRGSPDSLRVEYMCGLRLFKEWVCLEHEGYARRMAEAWWALRSPNKPPATVAEALEVPYTLLHPEEIVVWHNKKYPEILRGEWRRAA